MEYVTAYGALAFLLALFLGVPIGFAWGSYQNGKMMRGECLCNRDYQVEFEQLKLAAMVQEAKLIERKLKELGG